MIDTLTIEIKKHQNTKNYFYEIKLTNIRHMDILL